MVGEQIGLTFANDHAAVGGAISGGLLAFVTVFPGPFAFCSYSGGTLMPRS
jgi:hypothetical protein